MCVRTSAHAHTELIAAMPVDASLVDRAILTKETWKWIDRRSAHSTENCGAAFVCLVTNCIADNEGFTQRNVHLLIKIFK